MLAWSGVVVGLVVLYVVSTFVDIWLASRRDFDGAAEAAIVLGAAQYNGQPSPVFAGRLDLGAELYFAGAIDVVVVTGGNQVGDRTTEAKAGYDYLRRLGLPDEALLLEVDGSSTYQSLAAASRFLARQGITDVVVVTDSYHARRAQLVAESVGLHASAAPTSAPAPLGRLIDETVAVSVGRVISFRRLDAILSDE
ncbi:MAG: YdcF family protein [Acidimicrobiales bacterium]